MPAVIVPAALDLIETGIGAANKSEANAEAKKLRDTRPNYQISPESQNELSLAESELQGGMGSRAARAYTQQSDKNISSSLSAILKGGGNVNNIGDLYGAADEGNLKLAQIQDQLRLNQITNTVNARRNMTEQRDKDFMYNKDQWWKADAQNNANNRNNAEQQIWGGINGLGSLANQYFQGQSENKQMNDYLNPPQPEFSNNNTTGYNPTFQAGDFATPPNTQMKAPDSSAAFDPYGLNNSSRFYNLNY